jgi:hypothetical protein
MKNLFIKFFIFAVIVLSLSSCKKEYPYPSNGYDVKPVGDYIDTGKRISQWGKFLVIDAVMFVKNHETNEKKMYHHFGPNKTVSSMRWGGSMFDIETIIKDSTTYSFYRPSSFPGYGKFVLNGDTTKHYAVYYFNASKAIVEDPVHGMTQQLLGGSARPFSGQLLNYDEKTVVVQIQEMEGSIDGYNCRYWTQLTLKKVQEW